MHSATWTGFVRRGCYELIGLGVATAAAYGLLGSDAEAFDREAGLDGASWILFLAVLVGARAYVWHDRRNGKNNKDDFAHGSEAAIAWVVTMVVAFVAALGISLLIVAMLFVRESVWPVWARHYLWLTPTCLALAILEFVRRQRSARTGPRRPRRSVPRRSRPSCLARSPFGTRAVGATRLVARRCAPEPGQPSGPARRSHGLVRPDPAAQPAAPPTPWRRRVFISFHHGNEPVAVQVQAALRASGYDARRIPFRADVTHDELLATVQSEIRACHVMICIPGKEASFVEHEVLAASTLRKMILFILDEQAARRPNTAFYGYPCFRLVRVARRGFRPVVTLVDLALGRHSDTEHRSGTQDEAAFWSALPPFRKQLPSGCCCCCCRTSSAVHRLGRRIVARRLAVRAPLPRGRGTRAECHGGKGARDARSSRHCRRPGARHAGAPAPLAEADGAERHGHARRTASSLSHLRGGRVVLACLFRAPPPPHHEGDATAPSPAIAT
ncbi:MAG: hypothetical protein QM722_23900 [Piscinibacter sp.]